MTTKEQMVEAQRKVFGYMGPSDFVGHIITPQQLAKLMDDQEELARWKAAFEIQTLEHAVSCVNSCKENQRIAVVVRLENNALKSQLSTVKRAADEMCSQAKVYLSECNCKSFEDDKLLGDSIASYSVATKDIA